MTGKISGTWNLVSEAEITALLKRMPKAEVYKAYDGTWQILGFKRFHDIEDGLIESMATSGKLVPRWSDVDDVYVLPEASGGKE